MRDKHSPQKLLLTITLAAVLLLGSGVAAFAWQSGKSAKKTNDVAGQQTGSQQTKPKEQKATYITYSGSNGQTALELLKQKATITTKDSSYGLYVDSIDGQAGGTGGKYWAFYINGTMSQVGANDYTTKDTDKLEWKFE